METVEIPPAPGHNESALLDLDATLFPGLAALGASFSASTVFWNNNPIVKVEAVESSSPVALKMPKAKGTPVQCTECKKHVKEMYASIGYHISTHEESVRMECLVGGCLEALKNSTHYRVHLKDDHELEFSLLTDEQHSSYQAQVDRQRRAVIKLTKTYFPDAGISDVQNARGIHTCTKCCFTSVGHGIKIHAISHLHTRMACPIEGCLHKFQVDWTLKKHLMEAHKLGVKELDEEQHARFQKSEQEFKAASEEMKTVCFPEYGLTHPSLNAEEIK